MNNINKVKKLKFRLSAFKKLNYWNLNQSHRKVKPYPEKLFKSLYHITKF